MAAAHQITTRRFLLRPLTPEDVSERYSSWFEEPQAVHYIVAARKAHDLPALCAYVEEKSRRTDVLFLGIFVRDGLEHIGNIKFEPVNEREGYAVMGILIGDPTWRGKHVATEVLEATTAWLAQHRGIREIILGVERDHTSAILAYEKAGFKKEQTQRIAVDPRSQLTMVKRITA